MVWLVIHQWLKKSYDLHLDSQDSTPFFDIVSHTEYICFKEILFFNSAVLCCVKNLTVNVTLTWKFLIPSCYFLPSAASKPVANCWQETEQRSTTSEMFPSCGEVFQKTSTLWKPVVTPAWRTKNSSWSGFGYTSVSWVSHCNINQYQLDKNPSSKATSLSPVKQDLPDFINFNKQDSECFGCPIAVTSFRHWCFLHRVGKV